MSRVTEVPVTPSVLRWTNEHSGYQLADIARGAGAPIGSLEQWLSDNGKPGLSQLVVDYIEIGERRLKLFWTNVQAVLDFMQRGVPAVELIGVGSEIGSHRACLMGAPRKRNSSIPHALGIRATQYDL